MKALTITLLLTLALSTASYGVGETVEQTADSVAVQVARILAAQKDNPLTIKDLEDNPPILYSDPSKIIEYRPHDYEGFTLSIYSYPYNTGGYYVLVIWDWKFDIPDDEEYHSYTFKDGILSKTESPLPTPGIDDFFANADQFPKDACDEIKKRITFYEYSGGKNSLVVSFHCFQYIGGKYFFGYKVPKPLQTYFKSRIEYGDDDEGFYNGIPCGVSYRWDGEKFVLSPDHKPFKEDITNFGLPAPQGEFAKSGNTIDDLYSLDKDFLWINTETDFNQDGIDDLIAAEKHGGLMAVYFGGDDGYTLFKTYKIKKDPETLVINAWNESSDGSAFLKIEYHPKGKSPSIWYTIQFVNNDLYLVKGMGNKKTGKYQGKPGYYDFEKHTWTPIDEDTGRDDPNKAIPIANKPLKKLSDFTVGEYQFEDYN